MSAVYLVLVEMAKVWFFARAAQQPLPPPPVRLRGRTHRIARRAARFSIPEARPLLVNRGPGWRRRRKIGHKGPHRVTASGG